MLKATYIFTLASLLVLAACGSGSDSKNGSGLDPQQDKAAAVPFAGVWMAQKEAVELRSTGKLESLCEDIRRNPTSNSANLRLIEASGATYIYVPKIGKREPFKMGVISSSGDFTISPSFKEKLGDLGMRVSVKGDVLTFIFILGKQEIGTDYVRSSEDEAIQYYAVQDACRN